MAHVSTGVLRNAANNVAGVASVVRTHIPLEVGEVAAALPGSRSVPAASSLATAWTNSYSAWATSADDHAQALRDTADAWDGTDADVAAGFGGGSGTLTPDAATLLGGRSTPQARPAAMRYVNGGMEAV